MRIYLKVYFEAIILKDKNDPDHGLWFSQFKKELKPAGAIADHYFKHSKKQYESIYH